MKKKFIKSVLIVSSLVFATSTFADMPSTISSTGITTGTVSDINSSIPISGTSKSQLNTFSGVSTQAVSIDELNKTSGEMAPLIFIGGVLVARYVIHKVVNKVTCGSWKGCIAS
jgi:hypothetical protein